MSAAFSLSLLFYRAGVFWKLLRRMRWLLLFLILIFAFNTPGEYVRQWPFDTGTAITPTYEGLSAGLLQSVKLCIMLAGLSLLLATTSRENLIAGFYVLAKPLSIIKLKPERFAARLWLTLQYVEEMPKREMGKNFPEQSVWDRFSELNKLEANVSSATEHIRLTLPNMKRSDWMTLALLICGGIFLLCA